MTELAFHRALTLGVFVWAAIVIVAASFVRAPYGRHSRTGWGPKLPDRIAWLVMEMPSALLFGAIFAAGRYRAQLVPMLLAALWLSHYVYRAFIYPFAKSARPGAVMPWAVVLMAVVFNTCNSYINARWISGLAPPWSTSWLTSPQFIVGATMFVVGVFINRNADATLRRLREKSDGYAIPYGGLYRWVSCPNYLGEVVQWLGWAVATWSLAGLSFAAFTIANLAPRAVANHTWYRATFEHYPKERKALIPGIL